MHGPSTLKTPNNSTIHTSINNMKPPISPSSSSSSSSSSLSSMKLKTLLQTFVFSHVCTNIARTLAQAKSALVQLLKYIHSKNNNKRNKKLFFGSFRLHYNWGSTRSNSYVYYDASWSSALHETTTTTLDYVDEDNELSKYLHWLEEKGGGRDEELCNEIDKLADLFIANCHEKFRLEKQESYRKFQEMMARSV